MSPTGLAALFAQALVSVGLALSSFFPILASTFLRPLAPRRYVAPLLRYYGRSDLCQAWGLRPVRGLDPRAFPGRVPCFMHTTFRPFHPHPRPMSDQAFLSFTFQHWHLSLAEGNSIPLGA